MTLVQDLLRDERGAVTIDWVGLTSGVLLLGITLVYAIYNSGVASGVFSINQALGGIGVNDVGAAPDFSGSDGVVDVLSTMMLLSDGTQIPLGSKVTDSKTTADGLNIVVLQMPGGREITIVSNTAPGGPPKTDSLVTAGNTITTAGGDVYDMSTYSAAPSAT